MGAGASTLGEDSSTTLSPPEALARKEAGNRAFEAGRFSEAEDAYTEAIGLANLYSMSPSGKPASPSALSALWSNRSAARQKLNKPGEALADALIAVTMRPRWAKGYWRAGVAAMTLEQWQLAREYLRRALALTPEGSSSHHSISIELEKATSHRPVGIKDGPGSLVTWGLLPSEGCRGGRGGQMMQSSPRVVAGLRGQHMVDVSCGAMHTIAVTSTGVYSWGNNTHGQCGMGMSAPARGGSGGGVDGDAAAHNISVPQLVPSLIGTKVKAVSCGSGHSCAIDEGGVVWSWGISGQGQLGLGADFASRSVATPTAVLKLHATGHRAIGVSCGIAHTAVLTVTYDKTKGWDMSSPSSFAFGWNRCGQLGLGCDHATVECVHDPTSVLFGDDITAQQIACGGAHTLVVTQSGRLFATGSGSCGQLGLGSGTRNNLLADGNDPGETSKVNASTSDALAILSAGKKMMNVHPDVFAYQEVHVGSESHAVAFACAGEEFSCVVTRGTQDVFAFGLNNAGQCGTGHTKNCVVPTLVSDMSGKMVHSLVSGKAVTRALTESGEVWGWGGWVGTEGILDQPPSDAQSVAPRLPQKYSKLKKRVRQLEIGRSHYAALLYATSPEQSYIDHERKQKKSHGTSSTKLGARYVVQVGRKYNFLLQAVDDGGQNVDAGCEQFHVRSRHTSSGAISFAESVFDDNFDGTYALSVAPVRTGIFVVEVQLHGEHVSGSPFEIAAVASPKEELEEMIAEDRSVVAFTPQPCAEGHDNPREEEMAKRRLIMARLRREEMTRRRAKEALEKEQRRVSRELAAERRRKKQKRCGGGFVVNYQNLSFDGDDAATIQKGRSGGGGAAKSAW